MVTDVAHERILPRKMLLQIARLQFGSRISFITHSYHWVRFRTQSVWKCVYLIARYELLRLAMHLAPGKYSGRRWIGDSRKDVPSG